MIKLLHSRSRGLSKNNGDIRPNWYVLCKDVWRNFLPTPPTVNLMPRELLNKPTSKECEFTMGGVTAMLFDLLIFYRKLMSASDSMGFLLWDLQWQVDNQWQFFNIPEITLYNYSNYISQPSWNCLLHNEKASQAERVHNVHKEYIHAHRIWHGSEITSLWNGRRISDDGIGKSQLICLWLFKFTLFL